MMISYLRWLRWPVRGSNKVEPISSVSKEFPEPPSEIIIADPETEAKKQSQEELIEEPTKKPRLSIWV